MIGEPTPYSSRPSREPQSSSPAHGGLAAFARADHLHPLVAFGMVAIDQMLFLGIEGPSFGVLCFISFMVGLALVLPCALIQRYSDGDQWGPAIGKSMLVGIIVAVPSSIPSALLAAWGIASIVGKRTIDMQN